MNNIDEEIKKALSAEDQKAMEEIGQQAGLFEMVGMSLSGRQAWLTYYMWIIGFVAFFTGVWMANEFLNATDLKSSLEWMMGIILCLFAIGLVKVIGWQQMQKLETMREIKRLEMRIMLITEQSDSTH